ncbi:MAG: penicillin-binding protein 2 [Campylobacterota bacterium]|nr:penicillin-binding protein 2 [Campylobacterota bacterium]
MRTKIIIAIFFIAWFTLLVRLYYISVESNKYYDRLSNKNTIKIEAIAPIRGEIIDIKGNPIAINQLGFKIAVKPHIRDKKQLSNTLESIVKLLPTLEYEKLLKLYRQRNSSYYHNPIILVDFISYETIMPIYTQLNLIEEIKITAAPKRFYPNKSVAAHIVGYVSKANSKEMSSNPYARLIGTIGKSGIEKFYNGYLQGSAGERTIKVSAFNEEISELSLQQPKENQDIQLNIDMDLQKYIAKLFKGKSGSAIVMDTEGRLLAAGSYPEYDLNTFVGGISKKEWKTLINDPNVPFTNKIIHGLYPPGSTIKTGLGLSYITSELNEWESFNCTGSMELGGRNFRCWKRWGHGNTSLIKAIRESCDDYFYKGSLKVGIKRISDDLKRYGLGKKTGIDLPREFIGTVPSRAWKRKKYNRPWYIGETLNSSIGQGDFLVTPIQITQFTALMATGKLLVPYIVKEVGGIKNSAPAYDVLTALEKKKLPLIQRAMYEVCNHQKGTAANYIDSKVTFAGKTGTAQVVGISQETKKRLKEEDMEYFRRSHAWFTTYGPYKNPQYIVTVLVEHGGHGGTAGGAIVSKIYNRLLETGYIKDISK